MQQCAKIPFNAIHSSIRELVNTNYKHNNNNLMTMAKQGELNKWIAIISNF